MPDELTTDEPVAMDVPVEPHYHHSIYIGPARPAPGAWKAEDRLAHEKAIEDPFVTVTLDFTWRHLIAVVWRSLRERTHVRVQVTVGGDWDAVKHVMTVRPLRAMLPPDQAAQRSVDAAFAEKPDDLELRRSRDQPHTVWYWVDDPNDPVPAPYSSSYDTADDAEDAARKLIANEIAACQKAGIDWPSESRLSWVKVFRSDNENYETYRWP